MAYTPAQIEMARRRQEAVAGQRGESYAIRGDMDGRRTMQIDAVLFHNARIRNQKDYGVDNCWAEKEFCDDMARRHPEIAVKTKSRKIQVQVPDSTVGRFNGSRFTVQRRNRFGRVTFHETESDVRRRMAQRAERRGHGA